MTTLRPLSALLGLLTAALLLLSVVSASADTLVYQGETPTGLGLPKAGITGYTGPGASDTLWDYVYDISGWTGGPLSVQQWGIAVGSAVTNIWSPAGWTATYYGPGNLVPNSLNGYDALWGKMAVIWYAGDNPSQPTGFRFQSTAPPSEQPYDSYTRSFQGDEWSAGVPEPSSILLGCSLLIGAGIAGRRRKHAKRSKS